MGHSTAPMTQRFREERALFGGYKRALLMKSDQLLFDELWDAIEVYIPSAEKSTHPFLIATILMSMVLELWKQNASQRSQLEKLLHEFQTDHQSQAAELVQAKNEIRHLDDDVDSRLRNLKTEIMEVLYPVDAAS